MNFLQVLLFATWLATGSAAIIKQPDVCSSYFRALKAYVACSRPLNLSANNTADEFLSYANFACNNKIQIMACMAEKVRRCRNRDQIMAGVSVTFNKCAGFEVRPVLQEYLLAYEEDPEECGKSYNFTSTYICLKTEELGVSFVQPYKYGVEKAQKFVDKLPRCLKEFLSLDPVPGCEKSGYQLYTDTLAFGSAFGLPGVDLYLEFEKWLFL